ncbi:PQQ-dependent sugar dehydrogenase [Calidifontimicrobium sp. SYSU G02091]|uniref:PQQ-dependent sugar dehydrogenase n=1 Tax=Calidifontimicrobium sp. SYSU G02091 TaxID=2926421 RepID=UPI001F534E14|nr:PQQ-dependent sugar dehydrogenase [Calidifontimicrobium sp. SYSU G02091]MCI1192693.1 PQQ-dependent sugar dehydrogenase [Calidifontimicrobium sp. SYSU G02091]
MRRLPTLSALLHAFVLAATALAALPSAALDVKPVTVARGLQHPWGLAFLPDGRMLVTERPGRLRIVERDGTLGAPLAGLPPVVASGQGGLLDVAVDPKFADNHLVYWSYSEPAPDGSGNSTAVARGRLDGNRLADVQVIFRQQPKVASSHHFGSRLVFAPDGRLFVTLGDRFSRKDDAQTLDNHHGKVVRIEPDGKVPADNPFVGRPGALPEIWSYGHRNIQGAAIHPTTGALWTTEHGPQGGDELNVTEAGRNYGWPVITYGRNYGTGTRIGEGTERADVVAPLRHWVPTSIAPSGMAFVTSDRYPGWKGSVLLGALRAQALVRVSLDGHRVTGEERLLTNLNARIRDVRQGPDGWIYLLTDSPDGQIVRLER